MAIFGLAVTSHLLRVGEDDRLGIGDDGYEG